MSQNPERESFADALHDAAVAFEAPDTVSLQSAVRRGRQIKRRRAGATAMGGTVALGAAAVLAFTLAAPATGHGPAAVPVAISAANGGARPTEGADASPSPAYVRPTAAPVVRSNEITQSVIEGALEYALPASAQVVSAGGFAPNTNVEVIDVNTDSWYVQDEINLESPGQFGGTSVAVSVAHTAGSDTCATLNAGDADGKGHCSQSTLDGGKLFDESVPEGTIASNSVSEFFEWYSPAGYETDIQLSDATFSDFALTKAQVEEMITNQVFGEIAQALPADPCVGGTFSKPVDPPSPGQSPLQHVRCSANGKLYPSY